jgi:hypothetical protein
MAGLIGHRKPQNQLRNDPKGALARISMVNKRYSLEHRFLQIALAVVSLIPLSAGLSGIWQGPEFYHVTVSTSADSHMRYLSGLLFGIGILVWWIIPRVEKPSEAFGALTAIVFVGGLSRLWSRIHVGGADGAMTAALFVELLLTPALYLWHRRIMRQYARK